MLGLALYLVIFNDGLTFLAQIYILLSLPKSYFSGKHPSSHSSQSRHLATVRTQAESKEYTRNVRSHLQSLPF